MQVPPRCVDWCGVSERAISSSRSDSRSVEVVVKVVVVLVLLLPLLLLAALDQILDHHAISPRWRNNWTCHWISQSQPKIHLPEGKSNEISKDYLLETFNNYPQKIWKLDPFKTMVNFDFPKKNMPCQLQNSSCSASSTKEWNPSWAKKEDWGSSSWKGAQRAQNGAGAERGVAQGLLV